ncbi:BRO-N domain-containing protein [Stutzerimonas nitrititolerans]|uniref:BRO-N domain-containing protein n=1 Tax=Stutzerimonas nitrititolerans TaxID=2482751 RepID=UPI0028A6F1B4|nr:BRO family protein [Stutzerimonas nitrititolerans]
MSNATAIPKENNVQPRTAQVYQFNQKQELRVVIIDGEPWFVAADVCAAINITNYRNAVEKLDADEKGVHSMDTLGGAQEMLVVNESGMNAIILRCRDAMKPGTPSHSYRKWVTAEVLPAIRRTGRYEDSQNKMATLVDELIGMTEVNVIKGLIRDKAKVIPIDRRLSFQHTMHHRLHTRFNVPRVELIPAQQFEAACNFVAAYALDGEWLPKEEKGGTVLDDKQLYNVYFLRAHFKHLNDIFNRYKLYSHFSGIGSRVGAEMIDHFRDGHIAVHELGALEQEFDAVQRRLGLNKYRGAGLGLRETA